MKPNLYIIDLRKKSIADLATCKKLLSQDEMARMQRFATPELQQKFTLNHGYLRLTLGEYLKQNPALLEFTYNEFGKPFLKNALVQFNMAHSGDYCVIALSKAGLIGVDIEHCNRNHHSFEIAKRFFTPCEYQAIKTARDPITLFFHIWTQKEAFLKAIGRGLSFGLDQFEVATDLSKSYVQDIQDPEYAKYPWESQSYDHIKGYRLTVTTTS